jgi:hypothetical protein
MWGAFIRVERAAGSTGAEPLQNLFYRTVLQNMDVRQATLRKTSEKTTGRLQGQWFPQTPIEAFCHF